jgi:hypothetical protein
MRAHVDSIDAAYSLLHETVDIAAYRQRIVVVGGWSPFLLCDHGGKHPGTRDVDLLFDIHSTTPELANLVLDYQRDGYYRSAKHDFQLLRSLLIGDSEFMFNVDFLHPMEATENPSIFLDHIEWPEYSDKARRKHFTMKSIALPSAQLVYDHGLIVDHKVLWKDLEFTVPLVDEIGLLVTKLKSFKSPKRQRDSYDIYLAVDKPRDRSELVSRMKYLREASDVVDALLMTFKEQLENEQTALTFDRNVAVFDASISDASRKVLGFLEESKPRTVDH